MDILLSIKPLYAYKIFDGSKKYEFRKKLPKKPIKRVYVYVSMPIKKIIGYFEVDYIVSDNYITLWDKTKESAGITWPEYIRYFSNSKIAYGIHIQDVVLFKNAVDPYKLNVNFKAPQSFCYFDREILV